MSTETENVEEKNEQVEATESLNDEGNVEEIVKDGPDYKDKFFYLAAEMENLKKRVEREKTQLIKFGNENVLRDLIEVVDNFERTVQALKVDEDEKMKNVVVGIEMIGKQFTDVLDKHGLKEVAALGKIFDPNFHEAILQDDKEGAAPLEVITVHQKGYVLNERLIRPARVVVQKDNN